MKTIVLGAALGDADPGSLAHPQSLHRRGPGHLGWTMGCGSGQIVADLIAGRMPEIDMAGFALADH
jgi:D-amino-acid dehydrogenase